MTTTTTTTTTKRKKCIPHQPPIPASPLTTLAALTLLALLLTPYRVNATIEEVEITPSSTAGIELGELSFPQFIFAAIIFLKIVALYASGVLPVEIDLGDKFPIFGGGVSTGLGDEYGEYGDYAEYSEYYEGDGDEGGDYTVLTRRRLEYSDSHPRAMQMSVPHLALDCTLQYLCDVDRWTAMEHHSLVERALAYLLRNKDSVWKRKSREMFGGLGTCREMYPCPIDVQGVVGIRIPGSEHSHLNMTH